MSTDRLTIAILDPDIDDECSPLRRALEHAPGVWAWHSAAQGDSGSEPDEDD